MRLFDTHCHLDVSAFDSDRDLVLKACAEQSVNQLLIPGIAREGWQGLLQLCAANAGLYPALGLHPVFSQQHQDQDLAVLRQLVEREPPVAIGEIGLDYWIKDADKQRQQFFLDAQLALAEQHQLPVVLHVRKAHDAMLQTLKRFDLVGGTCHAFNGSLQQAEHYLSLGFKLGFGGMLTYPNASKLRRLAKELPDSALVLETDAPDMVGAAHQYQRNSPAYLPEVVKTLAELRNQTETEIAAFTTANAEAVFGLDAR